MAIKEHKSFVALSESLYWKQAYLKVLTVPLWKEL